jgi:hypothetical protein
LLILLIIGVVVSAILHYGLKYYATPGFESFCVKVVVGWVGAWFNSAQVAPYGWNSVAINTTDCRARRIAISVSSCDCGSHAYIGTSSKRDRPNFIGRAFPMRLRALALAAALLWPVSGFSQLTVPSFKTGNQLYEECTAPLGTLQRGNCLAYVTGMVDVLLEARLICPAIGVTGGELVDVITNYFYSHPEVQHLTAASEGKLALQEEFPCDR